MKQSNPSVDSDGVNADEQMYGEKTSVNERERKMNEIKITQKNRSRKK